MINPKDRLSILYADNTVYTDYSRQACDFGRDTFTITFNNDEDYLYIGYNKPFNALYFDITTVNTSTVVEGEQTITKDNIITAEYYNGSAWVEMDIFDDTLGWTRNGFIQWDENSSDELYQDKMNEVAVNSVTKYFIRLSISDDSSAIVFNGINIIFSDDQSLKQAFSSILDSSFFINSETNHIMSHISARDEIVQYLRRSKADLSPWDILKLHEVKLAATYLALSKIFFNKSDLQDDVWFNKSEFYKNEAYKVLKSVVVTINATVDEGISQGHTTTQVILGK